MRHIWVLSDFHLSFGVPSKSMEVFGPEWSDWTTKIQKACEELISPDDLLLIAGDISWAGTLAQVEADLKWIHNLPGTKVILKGNHDHWWPSSQKLKELLPSSIHFIYNNIFEWNGVCIGGSRLWDTSEYFFKSLVISKPNPLAKEEVSTDLEKEKLFERELQRLELSLKQMNPHAICKIAMTHYPPIGLELMPSKASKILEKYGIDICVFGHLHSVDRDNHPVLFGKKNGISYHLTSCDYLDFKPIKVFSF